MPTSVKRECMNFDIFDVNNITMRHTFQLKSGDINANLIRNIMQIFQDKDLKITIETRDLPAKLSQKQLADRVLNVVDQFKGVKVDPNLDLSSLANESNL